METLRQRRRNGHKDLKKRKEKSSQETQRQGKRDIKD